MAGSVSYLSAVKKQRAKALESADNTESATRAAVPQEPDYAELHMLSNFTFLEGASHPEELVLRAAELGYKAVAITDECTLSGAVRAHIEAKVQGVKLLVGSRFKVDGRLIILLAMDRQGYAQLCELITRGRRRAEKGSYQLALADFEQGLERCLCLLQPGPEIRGLEVESCWLAEHFPQRGWLLAERLLDSDDGWRYRRIADWAREHQFSCVAAGAVLMHSAKRKPLQDMLRAIKLCKPIDQCGWVLAANAEGALRSRKKLAQLYAPELLQETVRVADACHFSLDELRYEYPAELVPGGLSAAEHLRTLVEEGVLQRFPDGVPQKVRDLIEHELAVIAQLNYEPYFLTIDDIVRFARSQGILCQGRGSAANSVVCYCLHITEVNPLKVNLLFERFISPERNEPPDIDVDFEHQRREEVIQYIYSRYGRDRAGLAAAITTYRTRSALRDAGKALGFDEQYIAWLLSQLDKRDRVHNWFEQLETLLGEKRSERMQWLLVLVQQLLGFPRHLTQHVGGFVISAGPLHQLVPIENAAMAERTLIQWDKNDLEALGLLKVDVLALGMLSAIQGALRMMSERDDKRWRLQDIPLEDPEVYEMLSQGDSMGVFQVESRAQMNMLPRLQPRTYYDLVIEIAIVRPGPIQGDMVHPYLRRRQGLEEVIYPSDAVREVLEPTLGVPIFQEQVIKLAMVAAGFTGGEADQLRRSMAAWRRRGKLTEWQERLTRGMLERGYDLSFAERICRQIEGFGEYGFPESHAASFALLVYYSAWLKHYEPAIFCAALLNAQPMGFYSPSQLVKDLREHKHEVLPVCVNRSDWLSSIEQINGKTVLRLGLHRVRNLSEQAGLQLLERRPLNEGYQNLAQLRRTVSLNKGEWDALAAADALHSLTGDRRSTRWALLEGRPDLALGESEFEVQEAVVLPHASAQQELEEDYQHLGLSLRGHPIALLRSEGKLWRSRTAEELMHLTPGKPVRVCGLVVCRQRPGTASGVTFVTLEDETGNINLIVWQATARAQRQALIRARLLQVDGILQREGSVIHVVAGKLTDRTDLWQALDARSRDFH